MTQREREARERVDRATGKVLAAFAAYREAVATLLLVVREEARNG